MEAGVNATTTSVPAPSGPGRMLLLAAMALSFYAPIVIAVYYVNRHSPSIKYRNPSEMAFVAMAAFLNGLGRLVGSIFLDDISCTFRLLAFGIPLQVAIVGYVLTERHVVLAFHLTELMVDHATTKPATKQRALHWLQLFLRPRFIWVERVVLHVAWNIPTLWIVFRDDYTVYAGGNCPIDLLNSIIRWYLTSFAFMITASVVLSFQMSKIVDNFGLRRSFQAGNRAFVVYFAMYFPILVFFLDDEVVLTYRIDLIINLAIVHTLIWIHIVRPVVDFVRSSRTSAASSMFKGTARVLDAFLHTPDGFKAISEFAKCDFMIESVIAWRALVDYRTDAVGHPTAVDIYHQFIAPSAPFPLDNVVKGTILKRYVIAFESNHKYSVHPDEGNRGAQYFDVLLDAVVDKILVETLPRFQRHPLGAGWYDFLLKHHTQDTLDQVLDDTIGRVRSSPSHAMPTIKNAAISQTTGRLAAIQTEGAWTSRKEDNTTTENMMTTDQTDRPATPHASDSVTMDHIRATL